MEKPLGVADLARRLYLSQKSGVLSTHSGKIAGYPYGSVVPFCPDQAGMPVILVSDIAQHTINIRADNKVSLTIVEASSGDIQQRQRLVILANANLFQDQTTKERYGRFFPQSREYQETLGFFFYCLEPIKIHYIGGFGKIRWLEPEAFLRANPFSEEAERAVIEHMNRDHQPALRRYLRRFPLIEVPAGETVRIAGIDGEGFDLLVAQQHLRFEFEKPVSTPEEARQALTALAQQE